MMGASAILTGVFLFAYTAVGTEAGDLAFSCITSLLGNFGKSIQADPGTQHNAGILSNPPSLEYAIMYAFTPESFPGPHRGTGTGTASTLLRFGGLIASLISSNTGFTTAPIYVSAAMWVVVGVMAFGLPFETHGRSAI
jgi:hypothetical protein